MSLTSITVLAKRKGPFCGKFEREVRFPRLFLREITQKWFKREGRREEGGGRRGRSEKGEGREEGGGRGEGGREEGERGREEGEGSEGTEGGRGRGREGGGRGWVGGRRCNGITLQQILGRRGIPEPRTSASVLCKSFMSSVTFGGDSGKTKPGP